MVKIKYHLKYPKAFLCLLAILSICVLLCASFINQEGEKGLSPSSIVLNKWYGENGRRCEILNAEIKEASTYRAVLPALPFSQTKLIFKSENLKFMLFAKGKILFDNTDKRLSGYGKSIHIIDISELKKGSEINLYISPINKQKSKITSDIILTSKSDYLLGLISKNLKYLILCILLFIASVSAFIYGLIRLIQKNKTAPKSIYFSCCILIIGLTLLLKNDISCFIIRNSEVRYILKYTLYSQSGIFILSYLCSKFKDKSKLCSIISCSIFAYSMLRIILFTSFLIPISNAIIIPHILLILSILIPIIKALLIFGRAIFTVPYRVPFSYRI